MLTGVESASVGKRGECLDSIAHGRDSNLENSVSCLPNHEILERDGYTVRSHNGSNPSCFGK